MPVLSADRPLATLREETIEKLVANYGRGELSLEAFERRLDDALATESAEALVALTADLPTTADAGSARPRQDASSSRGAGEPNVMPTEVDQIIHIFGGGKRAGTWTVGRELRLLCIFGGAEVDFSSATFSVPVTRVRMLCLFGGASIRVNERTNVVSNVTCIFGGLDNAGPSHTFADAPTLIIEGLALFGGADIRVKRTLRERWVAVANQMKSSLSN